MTRHLWFFALLGILLGIVANIFFAALPISAQGEEEENFDPQELYSEELDFPSLKLLYHDHINEIFNRSIARMIEHLTSYQDLTDEEEKKQALSVLASPAEGEEDRCFETGEHLNVSTYCIARRSDLLYEAYLHALDRQRNNVPETPNETSVGKVRLLNLQQQAIDREKIAAKKTLDMTLTAYQELQTAFPLHLQFEQMKKNLITYRDRLVEVRKKVDTFPKRFINATSDQCL